MNKSRLKKNCPGYLIYRMRQESPYKTTLRHGIDNQARYHISCKSKEASLALIKLSSKISCKSKESSLALIKLSSKLSCKSKSRQANLWIVGVRARSTLSISILGGNWLGK
ncbi:hypothetical protein EPI10_031697 [Gossypium australe]|uniref:Uncharacterized protein n=1 Tax=Gossypium australe TaxID=47621 RepID=A0A5B6X118_9ROSI|nr:hypothetical protein EPI10_031697 [Gossypium australe]